jgi:hypothetical protein
MMNRVCIFAALCVVAMATASVSAPPATESQKKPAAAASQATTPEKARPTAAGKGIRTIDAINIEGEIVVPQVLFITSRDNRRYRDGLGKNFRMGTLDVARSLAMPNRLCVAGQSGTESLKEE